MPFQRPCALSIGCFGTDMLPSVLRRPRKGCRSFFTKKAELEGEAYRLAFSEREIRLEYGAAAGRQYALTTLAQVDRRARETTEANTVSRAGAIADRPRYGWPRAVISTSRGILPTPTSCASSIFSPGSSSTSSTGTYRRRSLAAGDQGLSDADDTRRHARPDEPHAAQLGNAPNRRRLPIATRT